MPFNIGPGELILILIIALVVLGPGKLPDVAASLGKSIREFRRAATDITDAGKLDATASSSHAAASTATPPPPPTGPASNDADAHSATQGGSPGGVEPAPDPNRS